MSKLGSAPTLDDVAKLAGVSTATVSRCLNNPGQVVEATRLRVQSAVDALGYMPNFAARVMAAKRSSTIGAIIPTMENAIFARGLQAFQEELHQHGYTLLVSSSAYEPEIEEEQIKTLVARGADGLLLIGHDRHPRIYENLERWKIPALVAWSYLPDAQLPCIGFDNRAAMAELANHVIGLGHTRIGVISGISAGNDRARLRINGIQDAASQHGLDPSDLTIIETPYEIENGASAFSEVMSQNIPPTAVLCGNDVLAVGALHRAMEMGLNVPRDISITGFDDIELARIATPALTTVHVPHREMGRRAASALIGMLENQASGHGNPLATHIVERQSLGPPPDA
ncbi:HTH-type transcriptional repressor CytR [Ruegeria denitrificans]|uniref:HTH-type transcriptional repressor CytR n=1 Tax=Ruegeria denitrificans TaxID=1715692 RepID=A0A0P1IF67_9RHOB|nr:LacI family DNA-binding transcriptional regulator [Ruegeria denitrificans]CUK09423.1 HTH-type transcriptional repressor CytR [Ruegeria denitrificans]